MKFTLGWLKEHLETDAGLDDITETLTMLGLEVEEVVDRAESLAPFTVGHVLEVRKHPNADRLTVCIVDTGKGKVQVVCGAPNARAGMKGVFAAAGTHIPGTGLDLKESVIRGEVSAGMLCSAFELNLGEDHEGIIELRDDAPVGGPVASVLGLDDPVIDLSVTPNRGDCLGVHGIARELAAAGLGTLRPLKLESVGGGFQSPIKVRLDFDQESADACSLFVGRFIRGVRNGPSPPWLARSLLALGLKPFSALVDITNFLTLDRGRPLHVFDADTLAGDLHVRLSRAGESLRALDTRTYELDSQMTVIANDDGVLSLGGVIGGESSGCTEATVNAFLEAALFDPVRTAATGRKLNIESEARYRFERGVDAAGTVPGAEAATRMILELCGGEASEPVIAGAAPELARTIRFNPARVLSLGGIDLPEDETTGVLRALGFETRHENGAIEVAVPSWRNDVEIEADLVEEVLRVHGYDHIPAVPFARETALTRPAQTPLQRRSDYARRALAARGMVEAVTFSFMAEEHARLFGGADPKLKLANPISADLSVMRPSALANLIAACGRNADRGLGGLALFEVGPVYADDTPEGQALVAAGVRAGSTGPRHWLERRRDADLFDAKADALAALAAAGAPASNLRVTAEAPAWYHPGRSGTLRLGPKLELAHFGEVHPRVLRVLDVKGPIVGFEARLSAIPEPKARAGKARPALEMSALQAIERDFAFVVDQGVSAEAVVGAAKSADRKLITEVSVFDLYTGEGVGEAKKSLAISVRLQPREHTLTEAEIEAVSEKVIAAVAKATGGV
ncbi:MAG: phenylalanine--tRNA ligase subunit beta, partial [Alphaproteobacteria bacterium]